MTYKTKNINEQITWQEITPGGEIYEGGTSKAVNTGEWRSDVVIWESKKCKQCLLCAPFCPDSSIPVSEGKRGEFDMDHCKGCGICFTVCPFKAIRFEKLPEDTGGSKSHFAEGKTMKEEK